jgi:hyperosmotically inducible periplasmic protein
MDVKGLHVRYLSDAFCANCMTGGTKAEQFARYRRAGGQPLRGAENVQVTQRQ